MKYCKRIVICSDILATSDTEQLSNLSWMFDILKNPLMRAANKMPHRFSAKESSGFSRQKFFALSGIELDMDSLQFDFDADKINQTSIDYLKEYLQEDALLVGYEFSERTRYVLDSFGFTYIDLWLHPIRYMDDVLFGFSSNNKEMFQAISQFDYAKEHFDLYADRHKVATYKGYKRVAKNFSIEDGSALLVGQTLQDKAVLQNGKFLNLLDFKDEILELSAKHSVVYFSRHPFVSKSDDKAIMKFLNGIENVVVTDIPVYSLLAKDELKTVAAISSSVVMEGKYFGKDSVYFHKPIFELSKEHSLTSYISVFQEFMYPQFWASVLAPVTKVNDVVPVEFSSKKDKMRDMLGFYWSYKHIDKLEMMRGTLSAVDGKLQRVDKSVRELMTKIKPNKKALPVQKKRNHTSSVIKSDEFAWEQIKSQIDASKAVSFDVFDTLLVRPFAVPNDLFTYMEPYVESLTNGKIVEGQFREMREKARGWVKNSQCGEEVSLEERYTAIGKKAGLTIDEVNAIHDLELSIESRILSPRQIAIKAFDYAKEQGKYIAIVSDTFFTSEFLNLVLAKNGILGYDLLWSSMEVKLLKHSGNVYPKLIEEIGVEPEHILHIGDNKISDIERALENGINALHIPRTLDAFKEKTGLDRALNLEDHLTRSLVKGVIGNQVMDNPMAYSYPSHSGGSLYNLGFSMIGPMFYGFAKWVYEEASAKGLNKVYFLARDGEVIKKCYDVICANKPNAPKSEYVHVSRRALSVPSIQTVEDIVEMANINFSPTSIKKLLKSRFGLDKPDLSKKALKTCNFSSENYLINSNRDAEEFANLCVLIKDQIFTHARIERENMVDYLRSKGLDGKDDTLVVDIGHNGTLQKRLNCLLDTDRIDGLYFVTQSGVKETIYDNGWKAKGFVGEEVIGSDKRYPYNKYLLMFEACFLNQEGSTVSINRADNGEFYPNQLSVENEAERLEFIKHTHSGVVDFAKVLTALKEDLDVDIKIQGRESINPYLAMLSHPYELDLLMFNKVAFENVYSGRDNKYLVSYEPESRENTFENSYWKDHLDVLDWSGSKDHLRGGVAKVLIVKAFHLGHKFNLVSKKKMNKFERTPRRFFEDASNPMIQRLANHF